MRSVYEVDEDINWNHAVYMLGKLSDVVHGLVIGCGDARARLREMGPAIFSVVPGMLPATAGIRAQVERAHAALTRYPSEFPGSWACEREAAYEPTLRRIQNRTASRIASDLFGAWLELSTLVRCHQNGDVVRVDSGDS